MQRKSCVGNQLLTASARGGIDGEVAKPWGLCPHKRTNTSGGAGGYESHLLFMCSSTCPLGIDTIGRFSPDAGTSVSNIPGSKTLKTKNPFLVFINYPVCGTML